MFSFIQLELIPSFLHILEHLFIIRLCHPVSHIVCSCMHLFIYSCMKHCLLSDNCIPSIVLKQIKIPFFSEWHCDAEDSNTDTQKYIHTQRRAQTQKHTHQHAHTDSTHTCSHTPQGKETPPPVFNFNALLLFLFPFLPTGPASVLEPSELSS